jgi:hypothetical protein
MKLHELDINSTAQKALKENFDVSFDASKLDRVKTVAMLSKVTSLIKEAKASPNFYMNQNDPSYLKLVFMSQALREHMSTFKQARIILENEEVQKSEVILAAQDMVNSIQKMIEEVNDMLVKELPALTDSIQSEIGVNESQSFNTSASEALTTLNSTLGQSKAGLQSALNVLTGLGDASAFTGATGGGEMPVTDVGAEGNVEVPEPELPAELPGEEEEEEIDIVGTVGREKR